MHSNQAGSPATIDEARMRSDTIVRVVPPIASGASSIAKLTMARDIGKLLGIKDLMDNPDAKSDWNTNPLAQANMTVTVFNPYSVATELFAINLEIQYDSRLFVKNDVADS